MRVISNRPRTSHSSDFKVTRSITNSNWTEWSIIQGVIKTITKFSNVIGYQQPDLSINWTVAHVMLVPGQ